MEPITWYQSRYTIRTYALTAFIRKEMLDDIAVYRADLGFIPIGNTHEHILEG